MPKVRNEKGTRQRFSPARVMMDITNAYSQAFFGHQTSNRALIQQHTTRIIQELENRYGAGEDSDWPRQAIRETVIQELEKNATPDVVSAWLDQHPERKAPPKPREWSKFEGRKAAVAKEDPLWGIVAPGTPEEPAQEPPRGMALLGEPVHSKGVENMARKLQREIQARRENIHRSDWIDLWIRLNRQCPHHVDMEILENRILAEPPDRRMRSVEHWYAWWRDLFTELAATDPRIMHLWHEAFMMKENQAILGQNWLSNSGMPNFPGTGRDLDATAQGRALYRSLWKEYIDGRLARGEIHSGMAKFDLDLLSRAIVPSRDHDIDFSGWNCLLSTGALHPVRAPWNCVAQVPASDASELPQWMWMRTAMHMAVDEKDPTESALEFYGMFSQRTIIPSETILREAGSHEPNFMEDQACSVPDTFTGIQEQIYRAATATRWTGTMSMDWSRVRARGAQIAGKRHSNGVNGFLRTVSSSLESQGREDNDRPVTVSLPIWHLDAEHFIGIRQDGANRVQAAIRIPDIFFERLRDGKEWHLFDPGLYPELCGIGGGSEFTERYTQAITRTGSKPALGHRTVSASAIWKRLLTECCGSGSPNIIFDGNTPTPSPGTLEVCGVEGVGDFQILADDPSQTTRWPAAAVNMSQMIGADNGPDPNRMRTTAAIGARILDNAISLTHPRFKTASSEHFRPVCLGMVGYYEAIDRAAASASGDMELIGQWVAQLAETWSHMVTQADNALAKERGNSPFAGAHPAVNPIESHHLRVKSRNSSNPVPIKPIHRWENRHNLRFSRHTVWAPFAGLARISGSTPGGLGTLSLEDRTADANGIRRTFPSHFWQILADGSERDIQPILEIWKMRDRPGTWPDKIRQITFPDAQGWRTRILHAALIRPWTDAGISVTALRGEETEMADMFIRQAWWSGLSGLRFDDP